MNQYPLWRYLLLIFLIVLGLVYAAPNLYIEDPAIQISPKNAALLSADVNREITSVLKQHQLAVKSIKLQQKINSILIRFYNTQAQLKAQDVLQATLGPDYTVALNLASNTPKWLQVLGALPMRLGLDLRGGIHFLLQVDTKAMLKERINSDLHAIGDQLRQKNIRYAGINKDGANKIVVRFRNKAAMQNAYRLMQQQFQEYTLTANDQANRYFITATMSPEAMIKAEQYAVQQNLNILRTRVNELGVAEPVIQQQGKDQISVDLPGIQDTARAKEMIGKVATITFQMVDTAHDAMQAASTGVIPFGTTLYKTSEGRPVLLKNQVVLHGKSVLNATSIMAEDGRPAVSVKAGGPEVVTFNRITSENVGKPMATVYHETQTYQVMENGKPVTKTKQINKVISIATIMQGLGNNFQIMGLESMMYAKNLALQLRSGSYTAPVTFVQERLLRPSLGKENIRMGVLSCEVGSVLVILFMIFYYRLFGVVADMALVLNVIFVVAIMSVIGATMTLPGIAAIVLTVGMAVDANVLINERIREELRNGATPQAAIYAGYERAFTTIVDANVTTLIVAVVLFALGTGAVQGFAITLSIGLLTSMVTSIFFTRAVINLIYGRRQVKKLSIGIKV